MHTVTSQSIAWTDSCMENGNSSYPLISRTSTYFKLKRSVAIKYLIHFKSLIKTLNSNSITKKYGKLTLINNIKHKLRRDKARSQEVFGQRLEIKHSEFNWRMEWDSMPISGIISSQISFLVHLMMLQCRRFQVLQQAAMINLTVIVVKQWLDFYKQMTAAAPHSKAIKCNASMLNRSKRLTIFW